MFIFQMNKVLILYFIQLVFVLLFNSILIFSDLKNIQDKVLMLFLKNICLEMSFGGFQIQKGGNFFFRLEVIYNKINEKFIKNRGNFILG